ncbi:MAG: hypothetical protein KJP02_09985, partial [Octadecabacter sp.]|nr:hypothetical protein [Octadecabacter sp.]
MRRFVRILCVAAGLWPQWATAEPLPGSDDPALRAAALDWLEDPSSNQALWAIGEQARAGNIAARDFANSISRTAVPIDFPDLTRAERRALFPSDGHQTRFGAIYPIEDESHPALVARGSITESETPEQWIQHAQALRAAGMMHAFQGHARFALSSNFERYSIEAARFADPFIAPTEAVQSDIWLFRFIETAAMEYRQMWDAERSARDAERWGGLPWDDAVAAEFDAALDAGRWTAIRALGTIRAMREGFGVEFHLLSRPDLERFADLAFAVEGGFRDGPPDLSQDTLTTLGDLIIADAAQSAYLRPVVNACAMTCGENMGPCVARAALNRLERSVYT